MKVEAVITDVGQVTVDMNIWSCPSCGILYGIPKDFAEKRRAAGGSYYCPNGHVLSWQQSEADKLRSKLKDAERDRDWYKDAEKREREDRQAKERSLAATRGVVTRMRAKAIAGSCQFCRRSFANVAKHVATQHPDEKTEAPQL